MTNGTALYQTLLEACDGSPDGCAVCNSARSETAATELFQWLYKKAFYYFCSRHPESDAEEHATRCTQRVWERLLEEKTLRSIRNADAFLGVAATAIQRECWRCQEGLENVARHSVSMDEADPEQDEEEGWLDWVSANQETTPAALTLQPETVAAQLLDCLLDALGRIKGFRNRAVIILKYLLHLDDAVLAEQLEISLDTLARMRAQARLHGLDPEALSEVLDVSVPQARTCLNWLRAGQLSDEAAAQVFGIAIESLNSLRAKAKERGLPASSSELLAERFHWNEIMRNELLTHLDGFSIEPLELAVALDQARQEFSRIHARTAQASPAQPGLGQTSLAEDYEIALILGTTRNNVQAIFSRVKAQLRDDRDFILCVSAE